MNILYTNFHFKDGRGHSTYILSLLDNPEHTAYVACAPQSRLFATLRERGFERLIPIEFYSKPRHLKKAVKGCRLLMQAIEKHAIDIVHTNGSPDNLLAFCAARFSRRKFKIVLTKHNNRPVRGLISKWRFKRGNDAIIFASQPSREEAGYGYDYPRFHTIEHGIDLNYWKRSASPQSGRKLRLVSTAGTVRTKGWIQLARAIADLEEEERARISVAVYGRHSPVFEEMQNEARELCGMEFPGYLADARPELEKGDIGFNLSYSESLSFALREMMAMSLPALISDCEAMVGSIDESCGWVTTRKDPESVRAALKKILALSPAELDAMKANARAKAERSFSVESMIRQTNEVYASLFQTGDKAL